MNSGNAPSSLRFCWGRRPQVACGRKGGKVTLGERTLGPLAPGNPEPCYKGTDNQRWSWVLALPPATPWVSASVGGDEVLGTRCTRLRVTPRVPGSGLLSRVFTEVLQGAWREGVIIAWQVLGCTFLNVLHVSRVFLGQETMFSPSLLFASWTCY